MKTDFASFTQWIDLPSRKVTHPNLHEESYIIFSVCRLWAIQLFLVSPFFSIQKVFLKALFVSLSLVMRNIKKNKPVFFSRSWRSLLQQIPIEYFIDTDHYKSHWVYHSKKWTYNYSSLGTYSLEQRQEINMQISK